MSLTVQILADAMPRQLKSKVTQDLVDTMNNLTADPEMQEMFRDNLISYTNVLEKGKFRISQYTDAVKFVSFKLMGETNIKAYIKTFPAKYTRFKTTGVSDADIAKYVSAYNKSKLVNLIWEQSMVPFHVYNQDARQKALNVQIELMQTAVSEKVRSDAANSVLTHLKGPENQKIELEVAHKDGGVIDDLRRAVQDFAAAQYNAVNSGQCSAKEVAHSTLVINGSTGEVED